MLNVVLIGYGAIGQAICRRVEGSALVKVTHVVVRQQRIAEVQAALGSQGIQAVAHVPRGTTLVLECAGHEALTAHVMSALGNGTECAVLSGLQDVTYTGRKPPLGWKGSAAETVVDLATLKTETLIFEGTAREAAQLYPKNANVAATVSLAGLGLDATRVRLIADPAVTENIHEILVRGAFGHMQLTMRGKPLAENPKTSALTVLSALRFLTNRAASLTI